MTRLALDTSALIYLVEGSPGVRDQLAQRIGVALTPAVIDRATELRARHGFKTPDAIHLSLLLAQL